MSKKMTLGTKPLQITDGTLSAHVTVANGLAAYADSENSEAWHRARSEINSSPPVALWMKAANGNSADIVVTIFSDA